MFTDAKSGDYTGGPLPCNEKTHLRGHGGCLRGVAFSCDAGSTVMTACEDKKARFFAAGSLVAP